MAGKFENANIFEIILGSGGHSGGQGGSHGGQGGLGVGVWAGLNDDDDWD